MTPESQPRRDWRDRPVLSREIRRPTDNLQHAVPGVLLLGAVLFIALGISMSLAAYRTDAHISALKSRGVPVTYVVRQCASGRVSSACSGSFTYHHHTFDEPLSGLQQRPRDGARVAALIDPSHPAAYAYVRSAVFGRRAMGHNPWLVGGLVSLAIAAVLGAFGRRSLLRQRQRQRQLQR